MVQFGNGRRASSCRPTSPLSPCRQNPQNSTRLRTSGSTCATTGSPTVFSNPMTISSTIAAKHGTSSSINHGASCPSDCANGRTGSDQGDLVLVRAPRQRRAALHSPSAAKQDRGPEQVVKHGLIQERQRRDVALGQPLQ